MCRMSITSIYVFMMISFFILPVLNGCNQCDLHDFGMTSTVYLDQRKVPANSSIVIRFTFPPNYVEVDVSDATGTISTDGRIAIWTPSANMSLGDHEMKVKAKAFGNCNWESETIYFTVVKPDNTPPQIDDMECKPVNGETDVNPEDYVFYIGTSTRSSKAIRIVFNEPMLYMKAVAIKPDIPFIQRDFLDSITLELKRPDEMMPYDTEFRITLEGKDVAGNELTATEYSFKTMQKAE